MYLRAWPAVTGLFGLVTGLVLAIPAAGAVPLSQQVGDEVVQQPQAIAARNSSRVENLSKALAEARTALHAKQLELASAYDTVISAQRKARSAKGAAKHARQVADTARAELEAAKRRRVTARKEVDELVAAQFQLGNLESARAYLGADNLEQMLARSSLLDAISRSRTDDLEDLRRVRERKARKQATAEATLRKAIDKGAVAERAATSAERVYRKARSRAQTARRSVRELIQWQQTLHARLAQTRGAPAMPANQRAFVTPAKVVVPTRGTITSTYGPRGGTIHYGLDIANRVGTPIVAVMDGVVISSGPASGFGLWVRVRHSNGLVTVYGHIHRSLVSVGQRVSAGQRIATIGNRGESSGPHLHFEVHRSGREINPLTWLRAHGVSI